MHSLPNVDISRTHVYTHYGWSELLPFKCFFYILYSAMLLFQGRAGLEKLFSRTCYSELQWKKPNRWFLVSRQFITEDLQVRAEKYFFHWYIPLPPKYSISICEQTFQCMDFTFITFWEEIVWGLVFFLYSA